MCIILKISERMNRVRQPLNEEGTLPRDECPERILLRDEGPRETLPRQQRGPIIGEMTQ
jgi:hypothetical protein